MKSLPTRLGLPSRDHLVARLTHPVLTAIVLAAAGIAASAATLANASLPVIAWVVLALTAGFSISGSV
ncbi:hypothetical protein [Salinispora arenicola]|uniref:Uncharacterized protein n=1 Tax=Salinispora arenicola TaxID=168697 RepID=A0A542XIX3_SALAC|nr:hypothetical protein [Salinispora arenicola]TQL35633.1 hypothetical protein FB564_0696 [Salinispora arenicola]GIM81769.1 hypothetical protein Sar04_03860 [Salinispora arenicola]